MEYLIINVKKDIEDAKIVDEETIGNLLRVVDTGKMDDYTMVIHNEDNSITSWRWRYHLRDDIKKIFDDFRSEYDLVFVNKDNIESDDLIFRLYSSNKEALTMIKLMMNC